MKEKAKRLGTILFPVILFLYPLLKITQGIELTDTCYGLVNYRFFRMRAGVDGCDLSCKCARGAFDAPALWGQPGGNAFLYGTFRQCHGAVGVFFPERQNAVLDRVSGRIRGNQPVLDSDDEPV